MRMRALCAASSVALAVVLAVIWTSGGPVSLQGVQDMQVWESPLLQDRTFSVDSIRIKRRNMVNELHKLRSLDHGMRQQMTELTKQENALKSAVHSEETSRPEAGARGRENRQALSSSVFPAAFPGARAGLSVCEPWPACCPTGDADNCYGVVSAGVLGAHACTPYPMCCGTDTHNCFDQVSVGTMPSTSVVDATPQDISELEAVCEGAEQLKQCLAQTQRCMSPNPQGDFANTCTCFSSSLYCSYPQTPEDCSPCPMACQQQIYDWYKTSQTDDGGSTIQCPLFEKGQVGDDVTALDDGSFRPYEWYSDKELHPKSYSRILPAVRIHPCCHRVYRSCLLLPAPPIDVLGFGTCVDCIPITEAVARF